MEMGIDMHWIVIGIELAIGLAIGWVLLQLTIGLVVIVWAVVSEYSEQITKFIGYAMMAFFAICVIYVAIDGLMHLQPVKAPE
jgi:hypothetical protein